MNLKCFYYKDELYIRTVPVKRLFQSTMVHEVVNRGDVFAVRVKDSALTIVPGVALVEHVEASVFIIYKESVDCVDKGISNADSHIEGE